LRSEFGEIPDHGNFWPEEIYWAFFARRRRPPGPQEEFLFLEEIVRAMIKFSEFLRQQMQKRDLKQRNAWISLSEGEVWNMWVNALTEIMKENKLPYKVRNDRNKNKNDVPSAFVVLVGELQKYLPSECRKFTHSNDALAQGINRARHR
jgi:hypothetical protein